MKNPEEQLFDLVFSNLMSLPAYKLKNQYQKIFQKYTHAELQKAIREKEVEKYSITTPPNNITHQSIADIYKKPSRLQVLRFSFLWLPNKDKKIGLVSIISFFVSFLIRSGNLWLILIGGFSLLIFSFSFTIFGVQFSMFYFFIKGTFDKVNGIFDDIKDYVFNFGNINNNNLNRQANIITKNIIEDDISSLDYEWKKIDLYIIIFAYSLSFLIIFTSADILIESIKGIANYFNLTDFESVKQFNSQDAAVLALFSIGISLGKPLGKYVIVSGLQQRHKRLRQSLAIVENRITEHDLYSIQPQVFSSKDLKFYREFVKNEDMRLADVIRWYQTGKISMEKAAEMTDLNRRDFLEKLAHQKIDVFTVDFDDLEEELERG